MVCLPLCATFIKLQGVSTPDDFVKLPRAPMRAPGNNNTNTGPRTGSNAVPIAPKDKSTVTCYECGVTGHYSNECPKNLQRLPPMPLPELFDTPDKILHACHLFTQASPGEKSAPGRQ